MMLLPNRIPCGSWWKNGHVQGIAVDTDRGHVYYCFTTILVKTDLCGQVLGTVGNRFSGAEARLHRAGDYCAQR